MRLLIPLCFALVSIGTAAQKTKDHTAVVTEIAANVQSANFEQKAVRLAVVTFVPLNGNEAGQNYFGEYLTESIIGRLSTDTEKIKLFERKRVDAILKENEFMLSGMIKASEAIKIGQLLPIDALFSGTYTKLKNYIDVTGRLIDVSSGEILMNYTGRIRLTKNIRTLFPDSGGENKKVNTSVSRQDALPRNGPPDPEADIEARCQMHTERFREKLHDLSTSEKVNALVEEAVKTPFENTCGKLHYHFINALARYNLHPSHYEQFLLSTLDTIKYPSGDDRAYSILSYLTKDKHVSQHEWRSGIATIRKIGDHTLSSYLGFMFNRGDDRDTATIRLRVDQYFGLLAAQQVGLPRAISFDRGFYELMEALTANPALRIYVYGKYGQRLQTEPDNVVGLHLMYLKRMYDDERDTSKKTHIISWIADYFNHHSNKKSGDQLYDIARAFMPYPDEEGNQFRIDQNKQAALKYPAHDLAVLVDRCRDHFASYATATAFRGEKESRVNFCVRNDIPIPGVIPTIEEARRILQGDDLNEQHRIMKLLTLMGNEMAPLEGMLVSILDKRSIENRDKLVDIQAMALKILGTLQTKDQKAVAQMIASLKNYDQTAEIATEALVSIGKPAVDQLVDQLKATTMHEGGLQYRLVVILGRIGKEAKSAAPSLRTLLAKTSNKDVRYAIEAALQRFDQ